MNLSRIFAAGVLCGLTGFACRPDSAVTPKTDQPAASLMSAKLASGAAGAGRYLVVFKPGRSAASAIAQQLGSGGHIEGLNEELGFAVVAGLSADVAAHLRSSADVSAVEADIEFSLEPMGERKVLSGIELGPQSPTAPQSAALFGAQWNMRAIGAPTAWAAGFLGSSSVSVAIIDSGIDYLWPDLAGRVDLARSISLVPGDDALVAEWFPTRHPITDLVFHGTLVSSIVASNSFGFAGVTTRTTLFGVKVCGLFSCSALSTLLGILYAADHGADVINLSVGGDFVKRAAPGVVSVFSRVINYAGARGAVVVVAAGNDANDLDHNGNVYSTFCNAPHVVCVSATGPTAAPTFFGPFSNPDAIARYTNFGRSAIGLAAPGGGFPPANPNLWVSGPFSSTVLDWHQDPPETPGAPPPPPVIDGPACPLPSLCFVSAAGTSFSAPHVAGAAAQLVALMGPGKPSQIRAALAKSADDLGQPGTDPFYGRGRLNFARAVGAIP
jgi:lantibiotic leader peptide-processing serine protease